MGLKGKKEINIELPYTRRPSRKSPRHKRHKAIDDDSWDNLMLKVELDLRAETFLFISFLSALTSAIQPSFHAHLINAPPIHDILNQAHRMSKTKPYHASLSALFNGQEARRTERLRHRSLKGIIDEYDYMHDNFPQWRVTSKVLWSDYANEFGGGCLNAVQFGSQLVSSCWYGQIRSKVDTVHECVDINMFRYVVKDVPDYLKDLETIKCPEVCEFIFRQLPKFETSRMLRVSIPFNHICGLHLVASPDFETVPSNNSRYAVLVIEIGDSCQVYTRRVNCSQPALNLWRPRSDFTKDHQLSTRRFILSGPLEALVHIVATLQACRPQFVFMAVHGIRDLVSKCSQVDYMDQKEDADQQENQEEKGDQQVPGSNDPLSHNPRCKVAPRPLSSKLNMLYESYEEGEKECGYASGVDDDDQPDWPSITAQGEPITYSDETLMPSTWVNS